MGRRRLRNWWPVVAVIGLAAAVTWLLLLLWQSPRRDDLATYGDFALPVTAVVVGWLGWAWRKAKAGQSAGDVGNEALNQAAGRLATVDRTQWSKAAEERLLTGVDPIRVTWGRPSLPIAGPLRAAAESSRFRPLPGLAVTGQTELESGQIADLHAVYGGLRSGRLIITGPAGSGKTGAAVLLLLAALRHRERVPARKRPEVPVPVLLTAQDWNPHSQPLADWLTRKLQDTYPLFAGTAGAATAAALLASGRITVILDGLDDVSPELRSVAVQALSEQASFRLVLLSRPSEMATAARQGILHGAAAIELRPVAPADAASYLERVQLDPAPAGWGELVRRIRECPGSPISAVLDNPLALTLIRDTYRAGDSVKELLEFCDSTLDGMPVGPAAEAIIGHLVDRVLPAVYTPVPGQPPPPYDLAVAHRALIRIAARMNRDGTRDLNWWRIPTWVSRTERAVTWGLAFFLVYALITVTISASIIGILIELGAALGVGVGSWLARSRKGAEERVGPLRIPTRSCLVWIVIWLVLLVSFGWIFALATWLIVKIVNALTANPGRDDSLSPATSRHTNRKRGVVFALAIGPGAGILMGFNVMRSASFIHEPFTPFVRLGVLLLVFLSFGIVIGLIAGLASSIAWRLPLTALWLAIKWRTPVRLMRFLDDACSRNVLRTVGPAYQFRHARLQDRLAAAASSNDSSARSTSETRPSGLIR
jgi:hypothetical protein